MTAPPRDPLDPFRGAPENPMAGSGPLRRTVTIVNPLGLHYRPAQLFSEAARQFRAAVTVWNGSTRADGRSLVELVLLVGLPGTDLLLEVDGEDADRAMETLAGILGSPGE